MSDKFFLPPSIRNTLPSIREAADHACETAKQAGVKGAINWADLGVVDVKFWVDESGDAGYEVIIEEAAPGEVELINHIADAVKRLDLTYPFEIRTEW